MGRGRRSGGAPNIDDTAVVTGPCIVEEDYTTIYLTAGWTLVRGRDGHLVADLARSCDMSALDPIELEVLHNALTAAAADMDVTMWRTSRSTIVREMLDYSTAIFDADGYNVAQSARIPQHLNSMGFCLRTIVEQFLPVDQWHDGDVVITNDPYCGGQHLPDIVAFRPVFHDGRRVAIVGTLCHHLDVGGMSPGSYAAGATEMFQEGLRLPPVKLFEHGRRNDALWAVIAQNVRQSATVMGDLQSQIASLDIGAQRHRAARGEVRRRNPGGGVSALSRRFRSGDARLHPPHARRCLRARGFPRRRRHRSRQAGPYPRQDHHRR